MVPYIPVLGLIIGAIIALVSAIPGLCEFEQNIYSLKEIYQKSSYQERVGIFCGSLTAFLSLALGYLHSYSFHDAGVIIFSLIIPTYGLIFNRLSFRSINKREEKKSKQRALKEWNEVITSVMLGPDNPEDLHAIASAKKFSYMAKDNKTLLAAFYVVVKIFDKDKWEEFSLGLLSDIASGERRQSRNQRGNRALQQALYFYQEFIAEKDEIPYYEGLSVIEVEELASRWAEIKFISDKINEEAWEKRNAPHFLGASISQQKELLASLS